MLQYEMSNRCSKYWLQFQLVKNHITTFTFNALMHKHWECLVQVTFCIYLPQVPTNNIANFTTPRFNNISIFFFQAGKEKKLSIINDSRASLAHKVLIPIVLLITAGAAAPLYLLDYYDYAENWHR